jgi:Peptidase family M23
VITPYRNGADPYAAGQHRGIDVAAPVGAEVVAAAGGTVTFAGPLGASGLTVGVRTDDGFDTSYLHLSSIGVRAGDRVAAGSALGAVGTTGRRSAAPPHLHFGVREAGSRFAYRDPLDFLPAPPRPRTLPKSAPLPITVPIAPRTAPLPGPAVLAPVPVAALVMPAPALGPHFEAGHGPAAQPTGPHGASAGASANPISGGASPRVHGSHARAGVGARGAPQPARRGGAASATHRPHVRGVPRPAVGPIARVEQTRGPGESPVHGAPASHGSPARGHGVDLGWLVACIAMVAAATLLGRPRGGARSVRRAFGLSLPASRSPRPGRS